MVEEPTIAMKLKAMPLAAKILEALGREPAPVGTDIVALCTVLASIYATHANKTAVTKERYADGVKSVILSILDDANKAHGNVIKLDWWR